MSKLPHSGSVPKAMQAAYEAVTELTDQFCGDHLTEEYRDLARTMAAALSRKRPSPLSSGQARTWACGVIHLLGQLNFLSDKASTPHMTMADVCAAFGVAEHRKRQGSGHRGCAERPPDGPKMDARQPGR